MKGRHHHGRFLPAKTPACERLDSTQFLALGDPAARTQI